MFNAPLGRFSVGAGKLGAVFSGICRVLGKSSVVAGKEKGFGRHQEGQEWGDVLEDGQERGQCWKSGSDGSIGAEQESRRAPSCAALGTFG